MDEVSNSMVTLSFSSDIRVSYGDLIFNCYIYAGLRLDEIKRQIFVLFLQELSAWEFTDAKGLRCKNKTKIEKGLPVLKADRSQGAIRR